jgi:hypothetical protein
METGHILCRSRMNASLRALKYVLLSIFAGFILANIGYFTVPYTAGDFRIPTPIWLIPVGELLIFPLLLSDSKTGALATLAFDSAIACAILWAIRHYLHLTFDELL